MLDLPRDHRISHDANAVRVGDHHRTIEKPGIVDPCRAGHLAIAVEREPGREHGVVAVLAPWMNRRDPSTHRAFTNLKFALAGNERSVPHFNPLHIGDGIKRAGCTVKWRAEIAGARFALGRKVDNEESDSDDRYKSAYLQTGHRASGKAGSISEHSFNLHIRPESCPNREGRAVLFLHLPRSTIASNPLLGDHYG